MSLLAKMLPQEVPPLVNSYSLMKANKEKEVPLQRDKYTTLLELSKMKR